MIDLGSIPQHIEKVMGHSLKGFALSPVSGGGINQAFRISSRQYNYFIKLNRPELSPMFIAEARGLEQLAAISRIRIPQVICHGQTEKYSYLILEFIECHGLNKSSNRLLGEQLAELHRVEQPFFGWVQDNTIGSTPQINTKSSNWLAFWHQHRLGQQLEFIKKNGYPSSLYDLGQQLTEQLSHFFADYDPKPALLHGDLWSGNAASDHNDIPMIFDPACYYGDRETDMAMTELFGGFDQGFYHAYRACYPLDQGYEIRKNLYNLYHILNHVNLFGGGYISQAETMTQQLLAICH